MARCFALRAARVEPAVHSLLLGASSEGNVTRVRSLLSRGGADAANASNINLWTPLLFAAEGGSLEIVLDLIAAGANCNHTSNGGWSALMLAAERGYGPVVGALISAGADVQQADYNGFTALINASHNGHIACVRALLEAGADAAYADGEGWTALFYAAQLGHADIVLALLEAGADSDAMRSSCGWSPLVLASANGHGAVVATLLRWGADVAHTQSGGYTSLMHASYRGHVDVALLLLAHGADVRQATTDGYTALQHAAYQGHCELMRVLLDAGANPLQTTRYGRSSLHAAKNRLSALQLLCAYLPARGDGIITQMPPDTDAACTAWLVATRRWTSPLHHIEFLAFARVRALLLDGADVRAGDGRANAPSPLSVALERLEQDPADERARLVLSTVTPWTPRTHLIFARSARRRAAQLVELGSRLARTVALVPAGQEAALVDVWIALVLPLAMVRPEAIF